jgi:imidazolonepropionase-like amidohydrolase
VKTVPRLTIACIALPLCVSAIAQPHASPLAPYIKEDAPVLVLNHVRLIDGTGAAPQQDMRIDIAAGKILSVQTAATQSPYPPNAKVLDLTGKTVIPGLVGMHEHMFYPLPDRPESGAALYGEMADSAPRLYLAGGVTTARTAGSMEPYTDLALKKEIDGGQIPGPKLDVTGPYLEGQGTFALQLHQLVDAAEAARTVDYWAAEGATSFKAYMNITADELTAAIDRAHAHGLKITGHLCSVGFRQAAGLGIDNLEHGLVVDTEFFPGKKPDECPGARQVEQFMATSFDLAGPEGDDSRSRFPPCGDHFYSCHLRDHRIESPADGAGERRLEDAHRAGGPILSDAAVHGRRACPCPQPPAIGNAL